MGSRRKRSGTFGLAAVWLFCTALFITQLNAFEPLKGTGYLSFALAGPLSFENLLHKRLDAMMDPKEVMEEDAVHEMIASYETRSSLETSPLEYPALNLYSLLVPFALWTLLVALMQEGYLSRLFLIRYIHDSDGEKGAAGI